MTAASARANPAVRDQIADAAHTSDKTVCEYLDGYPPSRGRLAARLGAAALAVGVELATLPTPTADELARHRERRNGSGKGEHSRIARLVESVQAERERGDKAEARVIELAVLLEQSQADERRALERVAELEAQLAAAQARAYPVGTVAAIDAEDARARERLAAPTPAPIPLRPKPAPEPRVKLKNFPPDALPGAGS